MVIGQDILRSEVVPFVCERGKNGLFFLIDSEVKRLHCERLTPLLSLTHPDCIYTITGGEAHKNLPTLEQVWQWLLRSGANRRSLLVVIGGGVATDLGGFAASTYMRGIRSVHIPTTLLGMVDASVGGKTGIDFSGVKNIIGAFHEPEEVFIDTEWLDTLPLSELYSGYAEVIKTALLDGPEPWRQILRIDDPQYLTPLEWAELIGRAVAYKERIVKVDPREGGLRKVLNLGHTVAHALEAYSHIHTPLRPLLHGEAVIIGLIVEAYLAVSRLGADRSTLRQLHALARELYSPYHYTCKSYEELWRLMQHDKKNVGSVVCIVPIEPGKAEELHLKNLEEVKEALDFYRETFGN